MFAACGKLKENLKEGQGMLKLEYSFDIEESKYF